MTQGADICGKIIVFVSEARKLRSRELFAKNAPYVELVLGSESGKTKVHSNGGKHGIWNETITLDLHPNVNSLSVTVYDKDISKLDDLIGWTSVSLHDTVAKKSTDAWYTLTSRQGNKNAGSINLKIEFVQNPLLADFTLPTFKPYPTGYLAHSHGPLPYPSE